MGKIVHTYELLEQLGQGGMGVVYKARHIHFNEIYALKRLWEQYSKDPAALKLFLNEGVTLRGLSHKNIVRVYDLFSVSEDYYIVMEYIQGRTLSEIIKRETGPIYRERAIKLFKQMLEGISYIHSRHEPIIHRDIKPLNVLVTADDTVKITDFGIAKALEGGGGHASTVVKGTPVYMSPEQIISPSTIDIRTDVYSLGMTFYEMLCGHTPFESSKDTTPTSVYATIMTGKVPPPTHFYPGISDALSDFVMNAIDKEREYRFPSANEMLKELERLERSGETVYQEIPKFVPPKVSEVEYQRQPKPEPKKPESEPETKPKTESVHSKSRETSAANSKQSLTSNENRYYWIWFVVMAVTAVALYILPSLLVRKVPTLPAVADSVAVEISAPATKAATTDTAISVKHLNEMIVVEGGVFQMGSNDGQSDEKPVHFVTVGSFQIGKYEVTQELWESVMGSNPSNFKGKRKPVEQASWYDAVQFCNKLSETEGLQKAYAGSGENIICDFNANGYRLPTEAEWEYAARGGNKSKGYTYIGSNNADEVAWYRDNTGRETHTVGGKQPNELGINDMSGNVGEWCWDWYSKYTSSSQTNPKGANSGSGRVSRGGSWCYEPEYCRVACRFFSAPMYGGTFIGFRLARTK
ncbi:MAG: bifunctional serine/threonine-protein kinase/formylglycine-generating enzyme family protein [Bacteroidetes bacterium]|nr:bifunctional serine/threonine-protein kinase/formylglycine-generating enzyme family protein [Bacteroidota bacterium]